MWSNYSKVYVFRDCFNSDKVEGDIESINNLLNVQQINNEYGVFITSVLLSTRTARNLYAEISEDDGTWRFVFEDENRVEIASFSISEFKEFQLWFEIEEKIDTGEIIIHYCTVKAFKEYQI